MTKSTTDFQEWLENNYPEGHEEAFGLYQAAHGEDGGIYEVSDKNGRRFIKGPDGMTLVLASNAAISAFQAHIERYKDDAEMDWESWYGYKRAMAKDD